MRIFIFTKAFLFLFGLISFTTSAQTYSSNDFVGTWNGTISATVFGGYNDPITMTIYDDGFYTETSGHLMPSLYPNTQQFEYQASTNRLHWWYLDIVYAGQHFYQHFYYEIVHFENDTLELHYNFWDDPQPFPDAGIIFLVKENNNQTPPVPNLELFVESDLTYLQWEAPSTSGNNLSTLLGYNVYLSIDGGENSILGYTTETSYLISDMAAAGVNTFYVTAVYEDGESQPSDMLSVIFTTPQATNLEGMIRQSDIYLQWAAPESEGMPMATLLGYNVFHKFEDGSFEFIQFTEEANFVHENPQTGSHYYYIVAVYNGGSSQPSNEIQVDYIIASLKGHELFTVSTYPNPVRDHLTISSDQVINKIQIVNQLGQSVEVIETNNQLLQLNLQSLSVGQYFLLLESESGTTLKKIIKN
jgi:hypothetical protein